jgi:predicted nucleic acid-binding protein
MLMCEASSGFAETFTLVMPDAFDPPTCRDRDDDIVLATALAGACATIVTGDQDLLILDIFRHIRVLAPAAFWKSESEHEEGQIDAQQRLGSELSQSGCSQVVG